MRSTNAVGSWGIIVRGWRRWNGYSLRRKASFIACLSLRCIFSHFTYYYQLLRWWQRNSKWNVDKYTVELNKPTSNGTLLHSLCTYGCGTGIDFQCHGSCMRHLSGWPVDLCGPWVHVWALCWHSGIATTTWGAPFFACKYRVPCSRHLFGKVNTVQFQLWIASLWHFKMLWPSGNNKLII